MADAYDSRTADKFVIRLLPGQRKRLNDVADRNNRSMNAEAIHGLNWWMDRQAVYEQHLAALEAEVKRLQAMETPAEGVFNQAYFEAVGNKYPEVSTLCSLVVARLST